MSSESTMVGGISLEVIRKRLNMYMDLNNPLLLTHLVAMAMEYIPLDAKCTIEVKDEPKMHASFPIAIKWDRAMDLSKCITEKTWAENHLTSLYVPGDPPEWMPKLSCGGGLAAVNAVSLNFNVFTRDESAEYAQYFYKGEPETKFKIVGDGGDPFTLFVFILDDEILPHTMIKKEWLKNNLPFKNLTFGDYHSRYS